MSHLGIAVCEVCGRVFQFNPVNGVAVFFECNSKGKPDPHWTVLCRPCTLKLKKWAKQQTGPEYEAMAKYKIPANAYEAE